VHGTTPQHAGELAVVRADCLHQSVQRMLVDREALAHNALPATPALDRALYAPASVLAVVPQPMLARLEFKLPRGAQRRYAPKPMPMSCTHVNLRLARPSSVMSTADALANGFASK
jgi:hypothetical protein